MSKLAFSVYALAAVLMMLCIGESQAKRICLKNKKYKEYLYAADGQFALDGDRRRVFTWVPGQVTTASPWELTDTGNGEYTLQNKKWDDEYLYASSVTYNLFYSNSARLPVTWQKGGPVREAYWNSQENNGFYRIHNTHYNTFLYASNSKYQEDRRMVLHDKNKYGDESLWQIVNC